MVATLVTSSVGHVLGERRGRSRPCTARRVEAGLGELVVQQRVTASCGVTAVSVGAGSGRTPASVSPSCHHDVEVAGAPLVVALGEVLAPVRAAGLLAQRGGVGERGADGEQVGGLPRLLVDDARRRRRPACRAVGGGLGQPVGAAEHADPRRHHLLQLAAQRRRAPGRRCAGPSAGSAQRPQLARQHRRRSGGRRPGPRAASWRPAGWRRGRRSRRPRRWRRGRARRSGPTGRCARRRTA